jgi:hypothetical protein
VTSRLPTEDPVTQPVAGGLARRRSKPTLDRETRQSIQKFRRAPRYPCGPIITILETPFDQAT